MITVIGPRDRMKIPDGAVFVNTTSRSKDWGRELSPFILGPCPLYGGYVAKNVENAWQFAKLYPQHADEEGNPTIEYFKWAQRGWADTFAHRYPMGKGVKPLCSIWNGEKLPYVDARLKIYIPIYSLAVSKSEAYARLVNLHAEGINLFLWDFDGYKHVPLGMSLTEVALCQERTMGHAFVLAMMLEGLIYPGQSIIA